MLQTPVLELAHAISHVLIDHEHHGTHSLADHGSLLSHKVLSALDENEDNQNSEQHSVKKPKFNIEFVHKSLSTTIRVKDWKHSIHVYLHFHRDVILEINPPPPKGKV